MCPKIMLNCHAISTLFMLTITIRMLKHTSFLQIKRDIWCIKINEKVLKAVIFTRYFYQLIIALTRRLPGGRGENPPLDFF